MDLAFVNRMAGIARGGGEIWDLKMAEGLEERGADITFYVGKPLRSELPEPIDEFETVEIPTPHLRDHAYAAPPGVGGMLAHIDTKIFCQRVVKELQKRNHELVQICSRPHFAQYVDQIDAPVSIVMHGEPYSLWYDVVKPWGSTYELLEAFDQVITVGGTREVIEKRVSCSVATVNPGVDTDIFTPRDGEDTNNKGVLFVGRFVPAKNLELLVEAFSRIYDNHPRVKLVLVGDGPEGDIIRREVKRQGIANQVSFAGYIPNNELPEVYRRATVVTLSSKSESYGMTLLEAMSCGVPVIAPDIGVIPEIVDDKKNGLVYPEGSVEELVNALDTILSDDKVQRTYAKAARKKAVDSFGWDKKQEKINYLYNKITNKIIKNNPEK